MTPAGVQSFPSLPQAMLHLLCLFPRCTCVSLHLFCSVCAEVVAMVHGRLEHQSLHQIAEKIVMIFSQIVLKKLLILLLLSVVRISKF